MTQTENKSTNGAGPDQGTPGWSSAVKQFEEHMRAHLGSATGGLALDDYLVALADWSSKLSGRGDKVVELGASAAAKLADTLQFAGRALHTAPLDPSAGGKPAEDTAWQRWPFNVYARTWSNVAAWYEEALAAAPGMAPENAQRLGFARAQLLEAFSPRNYLATNPEVLEQTRAEGGQNLLRGYRHMLEDTARALIGTKTGQKIGQKTDPEAERDSPFEVGRDVALTPGSVVLRNQVLELIQYAPSTASVYAEPILIVPAWIMKYYILDLSAATSLVRYLVDRGHTVFVVSWKNPTSADRAIGLADYVDLGFRQALDAVTRILPGRRVHSVGYCIGGTLLAIAAADLAAAHDERLASATILAGQTDFAEPGDLSLFISPSQLKTLDALMAKRGVLESEAMSGAFKLLRSKEQLWTPAVDRYLRGRRDKPSELMAWNADGTRMPRRMLSEYLEWLYLRNDLANGRLEMNHRRIDLSKVDIPMFVVGTETDHVAPWKSVYKARGLVRSSDYTFLLTSGGHNAGIVSGPENPKRRHRVLTWTDATSTLDPDEWVAKAELRQGSWWPSWATWLAEHSSPTRVPPPPMGDPAAGLAPLGPAPGSYVFG
jgi:polyhydroxyalkanoate synthase